jgi:hypothetical protein
MTETMARKLNVENVITLGANLTGIIKFDIAGLLAGLVVFGFLIFIGYLADKSGIARYLGWD